MNIEFTLVLGVVTIASIIMNLALAFKKDNRADGITQGQLVNDISYIKHGIDDVKLEQKDSAREITRIKENLIITQNDAAKALEHAERAYKHADNAHSRINKIGGTNNEKC